MAVLAAMTTTISGVLSPFSRPVISSRLSLAQNAVASGVDSPVASLVTALNASACGSTEQTGNPTTAAASIKPSSGSVPPRRAMASEPAATTTPPFVPIDHLPPRLPAASARSVATRVDSGSSLTRRTTGRRVSVRVSVRIESWRAAERDQHRRRHRPEPRARRRHGLNRTPAPYPEQGVGITIRLCREVDRRSVGGGPDLGPRSVFHGRPIRGAWLLPVRAGADVSVVVVRRRPSSRRPRALRRTPGWKLRLDSPRRSLRIAAERRGQQLWPGRMWRGPDGCVLECPGGKRSGGFGACRRDREGRCGWVHQPCAGQAQGASAAPEPAPPRRPRRLRRRRSPGVARISPASTRCGPGRSSPSVGPAVVPRRSPPRASDRRATERTSSRAGPAASAGGTRTAFPSEPRPRLSATTRSSIVVAGPTVLRDSRMLRELTSRLRSLPLLNLFFRRRGANECARLPLLPTSVVHTWSSARH